MEVVGKIGGPAVGNYCLIINSSTGQTCCEKIRVSPLLSCNLIIRIGKRWKIAGGCRVTGGRETFLKNRTLRSSFVAQTRINILSRLSSRFYLSLSVCLSPSLGNFSNGFEKSDRREKRGRSRDAFQPPTHFRWGERWRASRQSSREIFNAYIIQGRANEKFEFRRATWHERRPKSTGETLTNAESVSTTASLPSVRNEIFIKKAPTTLNFGPNRQIFFNNGEEFWEFSVIRHWPPLNRNIQSCARSSRRASFRKDSSGSVAPRHFRFETRRG